MRRAVIALISAAALTLATPVGVAAQPVATVASPTGSSSSENGGLPTPGGYLDGLGDVVGSSGNPAVDRGLTLLVDWALGAVLITVIGGLVATFL